MDTNRPEPLPTQAYRVRREGASWYLGERRIEPYRRVYVETLDGEWLPAMIEGDAHAPRIAIYLGACLERRAWGKVAGWIAEGAVMRWADEIDFDAGDELAEAMRNERPAPAAVLDAGELGANGRGDREGRT